MQDTDWDDLRYFLAVARAGSVAGAAKHLRVNHSTVLRRLGNLEARLGVRLFERLPAGYAMKPVGEFLAERLSSVGANIETAQRQLSGLDSRLSGTIRLTTTDTLMQGLLMPHLGEFRKAHPGIQLQLVVNNTLPEPDQARSGRRGQAVQQAARALDRTQGRAHPDGDLRFSRSPWQAHKEGVQDDDEREALERFRLGCPRRGAGVSGAGPMDEKARTRRESRGAC